MTDETLIDLEDMFGMLDDENAPRMQVWATIALCERLDELNRQLEDFFGWFVATSPRD